MNSVVVSSQLRMQEAAAMIKTCNESGLSVRKWLEENHISRTKYFYWKRKLKDACLDELCPSFVELSSSPIREARASYNEGDVSASIRIGNTRIEIYSTATAGFLQKLLEAAGHAE